eukprot:scaffold86_cov338-Pavlova_lutheri.AAC.97
MKAIETLAMVGMGNMCPNQLAHGNKSCLGRPSTGKGDKRRTARDRSPKQPAMAKAAKTRGTTGTGAQTTRGMLHN